MISIFASRHNTSGFSLLELLAGLLILALLAALIFPILAQSHESTGHNQSCISNEKQVALGILQYTQDYDENFPTGYTFPMSKVGKTFGLGWVGQIYAYAQNTHIFACPNDQTPNIGNDTQHPEFYKCSYLLNANIASTGVLSRLTSSAHSVLICEGVGNQIRILQEANHYVDFHPGPQSHLSSSTDGLNYIYYEPDGKFDGSVQLETGVVGGYQIYTPPFSYREQPSRIWYVRDGLGGRHQDGSCYAFADGHAKWLKSDDVSVGKNAAAASARPVYPGIAAGTESSLFKVTFSTK